MNIYKIILFAVLITLGCNKKKDLKVCHEEVSQKPKLNDELRKVVEEYILSDSIHEEKPVYQLLVHENNKCNARIILTSTISPEIIIQNKPLDFFMIDTNLVLIYTKLEKIYTLDSARGKELENIVERKLKRYLGKFGSMTYDPLYWVIDIKQDSMYVTREPIEYSSCDVKVEEIKFLPPEK